MLKFLYTFIFKLSFPTYTFFGKTIKNMLIATVTDNVVTRLPPGGMLNFFNICKFKLPSRLSNLF